MFNLTEARDIRSLGETLSMQDIIGASCAVAVVVITVVVAVNFQSQLLPTSFYTMHRLSKTQKSVFLPPLAPGTNTELSQQRPRINR